MSPILGVPRAPTICALLEFPAHLFVKYVFDLVRPFFYVITFGPQLNILLFPALPATNTGSSVSIFGPINRIHSISTIA